MGTRADQLDAVKERIRQWRGEGATLREIAHRLELEGITVDFNAVARYCKRHGIAAGETPTPRHATSVNGSLMKDVSTVSHDAALVVPPPRTLIPETRTQKETPTDGLTVEIRRSWSGSTSSSVASPTDQGRAVNMPKPARPGRSWTTHAGEPAFTTPSRPTDATNPPSHAAVSSRVPPPIPQRVLAALAGIESARPTDDPDAIEALFKVLVDWTTAGGPLTHPEFHERLVAVVDEWKARAEAFVQPQIKPLFTRLDRAPVWTPDLPLIGFSGGRDEWTLQDACEGTLILGATGSGKTSGSGQEIARSFLKSQFGGLVLTAKEDECGHWRRYAAQTGRTDQLCIVRPGEGFRFNFLDYQSALPEHRGGSVENVVELFHAILESYSRQRRTSDSFWANTSKQLLRNLVRVLRLSKRRLSIAAMREFLSQVPMTPEAAAEEHWHRTTTFGPVLQDALRHSRGEPSAIEADEAIRYWTVEFPRLVDKTRSVIVMDLVSMTDLFFDSAIHELFCSDTTIHPDAVLDGAVIVIDLPVKKYLSIGRIAQLIWKHMFQLAIERRGDADDASRRPVFLWADEAQHFWSDHDALFQSTARSARCASVYLTQNIPAFYAQVGGTLSKERVDGFLANLCTKIFHANNDPFTNTWAAEQIGKAMQYRASLTHEPPPTDPIQAAKRGWMSLLTGASQSRVSTNPVIDFAVQPSEFTRLRTGSARYDGIVDCFVVKSGATFSSGTHYLRASFQQEQRG